MAKVENYTAEQVKRLYEVYTAAGQGPENEAAREAAVQSLGRELGKKERSIRGKLSRMEIYIPKVVRSKDGSVAITKPDLVALIAGFVGKPADVIESLEQTNKSVLKMILAKLAENAKTIAQLEQVVEHFTADETESAE